MKWLTLQLLKSRRPQTRKQAVERLAAEGSAHAVQHLLPFVTDPDVEVRKAAVRALGFADLRVRHYGDLARLEVPLADLPRILERRTEVVAAVTGAGYVYATLDLEGLRSGNLNAALGR